MAKMPVDQFGFYVFLEPYVEGYYKIDKKEKARDLFQQVVIKYQESLDYYANFQLDDQYEQASEIITSIERYRGLLDIVIANDNETFGENEVTIFNDYLKRFRHFYEDEQ